MRHRPLPLTALHDALSSHGHSRGLADVWSCAAGFFKAYRGNVSLPNGYTLERWSPTPGNNHSIFFEPTTCKPKRSLAPPNSAGS